MDNRILYKTMEELRQQCRFAQMAFQNLRSALNEQDPERVFFQAHTFLNHAIIVSRFLWPARAESTVRGERLRTELKVAPDSSLNLQGLRGHMERFDESFEDWITSLENPDYMDMNLMPAGTMSGFKADTFHRSLDPDTYKLHFRGAACDLRKVSDELRKLEAGIQQWLKTHNPW